MALALPKSKLFEAHARSTALWQADLKKLFHHAKERYSDVVWELVPEGESEGEEVWGHKGGLVDFLSILFGAVVLK
jgi:hypothetical protein